MPMFSILGTIYPSLDTAGSLEEVVYTRIPESKQRLYLYRIQLLIAPPLCFLIVLELM